MSTRVNSDSTTIAMETFQIESCVGGCHIESMRDYIKIASLAGKDHLYVKKFLPKLNLAI